MRRVHMLVQSTFRTKERLFQICEIRLKKSVNKDFLCININSRASAAVFYLLAVEWVCLGGRFGRVRGILYLSHHFAKGLQTFNRTNFIQKQWISNIRSTIVRVQRRW